MTKDKAFPWEKALLGFTALGVTIIGAKVLFFNGNGGNGKKSRNGHGNYPPQMYGNYYPQQLPDYSMHMDNGGAGGAGAGYQQPPIDNGQGAIPDNMNMVPPGATPYFGQSQNQYPESTGLTPEQLTSNTVRRPILADTYQNYDEYGNGYNIPPHRGVRVA